MARFFATLMVMALMAIDMSAAMAQERIEVAQRRTLFDMLFGEPEQQQQRPPVEQPRQQQPQRQPAPRQQQPQRSAPAPSPSPSASLPEPSVGVDKAEDATRLAVFGDSLASDLARALERLYAEDPNLVVLRQGVGSSGFVRDDFFDWNAAIEKEVADDTFDLAVVIIGINDRQNLRVDGRSTEPLSDAWTDAYRQRIAEFIAEIRSAGKPVIWVGLPPMSASSYSSAISQISAIHRLAAVSGGAEFVDIYERFLGEDGKYSSYGPDLNGQNVRMRKDDGIHFSTAGSDKLAFFVNQAVRRYYREGGISVEVADPLSNTDAGSMLRPPFQGLGQIRLLEVAGAVAPLNRSPGRAQTLVSASSVDQSERPFSLEDLVKAPVGRLDAFGAGIAPEEPDASPSP
ncbi:hypothetical protein GCM10007989_23510 [Devosia pacifica]|uniref:SGNH hydrolase-type esterase domain-containing protein n=1 Tax=Devosia pacifica TaxID=1335967 RepID=A0A918VVK8_9HYPH|nr:DUF459 domain-containing protein [Devosia pacifica]GHA26989.1 hypothetical protein GCM10007989_23510 [Devosia pacifica]